MDGTYYSSEHEWIAVAGGTGTVGITAYAQEQLGDIVFVEATRLGATVARGEEAAVVESVKAASDIYAPVSGEIVEWNEALEEAPETVNADPMGAGWIFRMKLGDPGELAGLMDADAYAAYVATL